MYQVLDRIGSRFPDPRRWFAAAAMLAVIASVMGYIEFHDRADRDLALRQDPPAGVALQDFSPARHTGPADELLVRAEAGFDQAMVLSVPGAEPAQRALVAPLYPLSEMGQALIEAQSDGAKTALTAQVARRTGDGAAVRPAAIGLMYHPLGAGEDAPEDPAALARDLYGDGQHGQVVSLNGRVGEPGPLGLMAAGAFAANGTELAGGYLPVQPFAGGREAAIAGLSDSQLYLAPVALALALALFGIVAAMRGSGGAREAAWNDDYSDRTEAEAQSLAAHPKFAPIPSQREIVEAANARTPEDANWVLCYGAVLLRGIWLGLRIMGRVLMFCIRGLRNRLLRPEDEAL